MPRFFFRLRNGSDLEYDDDGLEMPQQFEISNGEGRTLLTVPLREVLDSLKGAPKPPPMEQAERAAKLSHEVKDAVETAHNSLEEARRLLARLPV
jgi:hypothetical protein